mmetsp:Transcript_112335/g.362812  ORF Transcript_112335/g.362812 Transcript_112335/m.362812 type:complete len:685 (-) Transcript_112335:292-2346(-)
MRCRCGYSLCKSALLGVRCTTMCSTSPVPCVRESSPPRAHEPTHVGFAHRVLPEPARQTSRGSPHGLVVALEPRLRRLEGVVGTNLAVGTIRALADVIADDAAIELAAGAKHVQAIAHEEILAPCLPLQVLLAPICSRKVRVHGLLRVGLQGAEHHGPTDARPLHAILHEDVLASVWQQLLAQAWHDEHGIGIRLDGPIMLGIPAVVLDHVPRLHEDESVRCSAVLRHAHGLARRDLQRTHTARDRQNGVTQRGELVATEDADLSFDLGFHEIELVTLRPEDGEAEERRSAPERRGAGILAGRVRILVHPRLDVLEPRPGRQPRVPRGVRGEAAVHDPRHVLVAFLTFNGRVARAWLAAIQVRVLRQDGLELLEARLVSETRVPLRMHMHACLHAVQDILVALGALGRRLASLFNWRRKTGLGNVIILLLFILLHLLLDFLTGLVRLHLLLASLLFLLFFSLALLQVRGHQLVQIDRVARACTIARSILVEVRLEILEGGLRSEPKVVVGVLLDAILLGPLDVPVAALALHRRAARAWGRTRADGLVEGGLDLFESGVHSETRELSRVLPDAEHGLHDLREAILALTGDVAGVHARLGRRLRLRLRLLNLHLDVRACRVARQHARCLVDLHDAGLKLLEGGANSQLRARLGVPLRVARDAVVHGPIHVLPARLALHGCAAVRRI